MMTTTDDRAGITAFRIAVNARGSRGAAVPPPGKRKLPVVFAALFVLSALAVFTGCGSTGYERAAAERFEGPVTYVPSDGGAYVLAIEERSAADGAPLRELRFFVYDTASDSIAYERVSTFRGSVRWEDEHRVRVEEVPGIVRLEDTDPDVYFVDARTGRRVQGTPGGTDR